MDCQYYNIAEQYIYIISSVLTFTGSLSVNYFIIFKQLYETYSYKILLFISINDTLRGLLGFTLYFFYEIDPICQIIGYLTYLINVSNMIWACCMSASVYQIIVSGNLHVEKYFKKWLVCAYLLSGFLVVLPFITSSYGKENKVCEIISDYWGNIWRFITFYLPFTLMLTIITYFFIKIRRQSKLLGIKIINVVIERGFIYTIIIAIVDIPLLIMRILKFFYMSCAMQYIFLSFLAFLYLQGLANSIVFFTSKTIRKCLKSQVNNDDVRAESEISLDITYQTFV